MQWFLAHLGKLVNNCCLLFLKNVSNAFKIDIFFYYHKYEIMGFEYYHVQALYFHLIELMGSWKLMSNIWII
jgi:hypothetical protein